jgi:hypothetical protein
MLAGKPVVVLSYSVRYAHEIAKPVAEGLALYGFRPVLVGEEPLPPGIDSNPNDKVLWFFHHADMAVFLATPDDRLESGEVHTRLNIIDEHRLGQQLDHLRHKLLVFKASDVTLPSNINPAYERFPLDDPTWIIGKVVDQARTWGVLPTEQANEPIRSPQSSQEATGRAVVSEDGDADATTQAVRALEAAVRQLNGRDADARALRRAELVVAGLMAEAGANETLGVHLANSVFARRHEIHLRSGERRLLVRTYLRHTSDENVPGIVWLRDMSRRSVVELLTLLAQEDGDEEVRAHALGILGRIGTPSSPREARRLLLPYLASDSASLRTAALEYLRERKDTKLRDLLDDKELLERDRNGASRTAALLDLPRHPGKVMERYIEDAYVREELVEEGLLGVSSRISRGAVERALQSPVREVRLLALRLAAKKQCMSRKAAEDLIASEKSPWMRLRVLRSLLDAGEPVDVTLLKFAEAKREGDASDLSTYDEERALELEVALQTPLDQLKGELRWSSVYGASLYEALGIRDGAWAARHVRRDLANDFIRLREEGRNELLSDAVAASEARVGRPLTAEEHSAVARQVDEQWSPFISDERLGPFLLRLYRRAALRVLVARGTAADIRIARRFASAADREIRLEALNLLHRWGTSHDAPTVLRLVDDPYDDEERRLAAETALRLAYKKDKLETLAKLREQRQLRTWAVEQLAEVTGGIDIAWSLLRGDDAELRLAATDVVWRRVEPKLADGLLSHYMQYRHFYNVVRRVDEMLYAPGWLQPALVPRS